ncbi:response regulator [Nocardioides sp. Kera G14]|uniref:response regulator n=1 Tax=Nocardioides sp. Kera G14 TaxID=2884264 RepID=UPI001D12A9D0|nr:response regulator transcription factor [Nocardioides sp. Kera G14]UDY23766.1 response regulator transcription factor [Nocardioides sp. Kera G14]
MTDDLALPLPVISEGPVSVLIVDDNTVVRRGLRSLLEISDGIEVVGEASDGVLAESMVRTLHPDVVLLDVRMPRQDGIQTARAIAAETTVIMMTFTDEPDHIRAALSAGASGYLVHGSFDANTLAHTIRSVLLGAGAFSAQALAALRDPGPAARPAVDRKSFGLSERQAELMDLIAKGHSNGDIAGELFLAEKTVKNHINAIFARLGVASRAEAIALWLGTNGS